MGTVPMNPLLFPKSKQPFSDALFENPTSEYRGAPFWSWNSRLEPKKLLRQIGQLEEMGMGGFHMHSRVGLDTPYLGEEFMNCVRACVDEAQRKGLLAALYDEDRWPSGAAGGLVTKKHPEFGLSYIMITPFKYGSGHVGNQIPSGRASGLRTENGQLLARYVLTQQVDGLVSFERLADDAPDGPDKPDPNGKVVWYAYHEWQPPSEWYNGAPYVDTLSVSAMAEFIKTTHEKYAEAIGDRFGSVVPSIFTDEPQHAKCAEVNSSNDLDDYFIPYTGDLLESFQKTYNYDLLDRLPTVLWDTVAGAQEEPTRYHYHDHVCERFVTAHMDQLSRWCRSKNIALTGHLMSEPTLDDQTGAVGECMRGYRNMDLPGVDMLCDSYEYNTVKQTASVHRQNNGNKGGVMSELYGVTGWDFDFTGHKVSGDWQAALGVCFRVHHLSPYTLAGEAKRDYPAAISYQSPWYKEYPYIETHFARLTSILTRGLPATRVAVIHPIESFWLCFGPLNRNVSERTFRDAAFLNLTDWLLHGLIDFDFISESLFPTQTKVADIKQGQPLPVGYARYDVVIVPNLSTIRSSTLERLQQFEKCGGKVLVVGSAPKLVDARRPKEAIRFGQPVEFTDYHILQALEPYRQVQIVQKDGRRCETLLHQLRDDGNDRYLFVCTRERKDEMSALVTLTGEYNVTVLDTVTGERYPLDVKIAHGKTRFPWHFEGAGSFLVKLTKAGGVKAGSVRLPLAYRTSFKTLENATLDSVTLSEPNVLLLDHASFSLSKGGWQPVTEILRVDNEARAALGLRKKQDVFRQPWCLTEEERQSVDTLKLKFVFQSTASVKGPMSLAIELKEGTKIRFDGRDVPVKPDGWWVDEDIVTIPLLASEDTLHVGEHNLEFDIPYGITTNIERVYILGEFLVDVRGTETSIIGPLDLAKLRFGDYTRQGLPFYAGNMIYHCHFDLPEENDIAIELQQLKAPVATVVVDGKTKHTVAFYPYVARLGKLSAGRHNIDITSFGNRENAFGPLHLVPGKTDYISPNAFRTCLDWWQEEYNVKPMGLLQTPIVKIPGKEADPMIRRKRFLQGRSLWRGEVVS